MVTKCFRCGADWNVAMQRCEKCGLTLEILERNGLMGERPDPHLDEFDTVKNGED